MRVPSVVMLMSMNVHVLAVAGSAALTLWSLPAHAEGDPARGAAVVERWCAICHSVRGTETDPERAPTFEQIAGRPGRDAAYLGGFLDEDHFPMTTYRLFDEEKRDVVALIMSLQQR